MGEPITGPNPKFSKFDRLDLERGLLEFKRCEPREMSAADRESLRTAVQQELLYRIENPGYETDCRARKVLTGGYN